jgi:succinate-acetate transporter protein
MAQQVRTGPTVATSPAALADPAPLGLSGFALTTFVLSVLNAGLINATQYTTIVVGLAVFYGGIAQLLAGMWEFRNGNTFGATAFSTYGAFWLSYAALFIPSLGINVLALKNPHPALGVYLLAWTIITGLLTLGSLRLNGALAAVFVLLFLTFLALTIGEFSGQKFWGTIGGWLGIATAIVAWYTALAGILRSVTGGKMQLPIFPLA